MLAAGLAYGLQLWFGVEATARLLAQAARDLGSRHLPVGGRAKLSHADLAGADLSGAD
jgi:uncharacterized protein YjbI with pentapeptide repeats